MNVGQALGENVLDQEHWTVTTIRHQHLCEET